MREKRFVHFHSDVHEAVFFEDEARLRQQRNCLEVPQGKAIASRNSLYITAFSFPVTLTVDF